SNLVINDFTTQDTLAFHEHTGHPGSGDIVTGVTDGGVGGDVVIHMTTGGHAVTIDLVGIGTGSLNSLTALANAGYHLTFS
ncbi:MAG TPA: hypothetical protein VFA23_08135, partial [Dongiaceae bacterium]|nr:hypothetical protein [Dongiaceae bacterium]